MERCRHIDVGLRVVLGEGANVLVEAVREAAHESGATRQHDVVVEVDLEVGVALLDGFVGDLGDAGLSLLLVVVAVLRVEDNLGGVDALALVDFDDAAAGELVAALLLVKAVVA